MSQPRKMSGREKALLASEKVFAEYGFDGATMDQIAETAGINKMLIYYHFKGKEQILAELIRINIQDVIDHIDLFLPETQHMNEDYIRNFVDQLFNFFEKKRNILRILTIEGMKLSTKDTSFFEIIEPVQQAFIQKLKKMGASLQDDSMINIRSFFIYQIPLMIYFTMGEKYSEYYHIDKVELENKFKATFFEMVQLSVLA